MSTTLRKISREKGLTLMELIMALALTGILMVVFISANVFIHKRLTNWSQANALVEEREFLLAELSQKAAVCDSLLYDTTSIKAVFYFPKDSLTYDLTNGQLTKDGKILNRKGYTVNALKIIREVFAKPDSAVILESELSTRAYSSLISIELSVSYKGKTDVSIKKIRNYIAFSKN